MFCSSVDQKEGRYPEFGPGIWLPEFDHVDGNEVGPTNSMKAQKLGLYYILHVSIRN